MEITVKNLYKSFGENKVFSDFSHTFSEGKISCIMGESGCGKTTLLNILFGFLSYDSGEVTNLKHTKISAVFQEDRLSKTHTVYRNIRMVCDNNVSKKDIISALVEVGLEEDVLYKKVSELSGGMKRRVSIVRAMLYGGDVYILDEPTKGLDDANKKAVCDYIKKSTEGKTVIWVTHDREEAEVYADEILALNKVKE